MGSEIYSCNCWDFWIFHKIPKIEIFLITYMPKNPRSQWILTQDLGILSAYAWDFGIQIPPPISGISESYILTWAF